MKIKNAVIPKDAYFGFKLHSVVKQAGQQIAAEKGKSLSEYMHDLLIREIKREGIEIKIEVSL